MRKQQAALLIELVVVVAIIALLAGAYLGLMKRGAKEGGKSIPKAAIDKSRSVECAAYLRQMRALLEMRMAEDGQYPPQLDTSVGMDKCPLSAKPYSYDPQTGRVQCTEPGHETL